MMRLLYSLTPSTVAPTQQYVRIHDGPTTPRKKPSWFLEISGIAVRISIITWRKSLFALLRLNIIAICHIVAHSVAASAAPSYGASTASSAVGEEGHRVSLSSFSSSSSSVIDTGATTSVSATSFSAAVSS